MTPFKKYFSCSKGRLDRCWNDSLCFTLKKVSKTLNLTTFNTQLLLKVTPYEKSMGKLGLPQDVSLIRSVNIFSPVVLRTDDFFIVYVHIIKPTVRQTDLWWLFLTNKTGLMIWSDSQCLYLTLKECCWAAALLKTVWALIPTGCRSEKPLQSCGKTCARKDGRQGAGVFKLCS